MYRTVQQQLLARIQGILLAKYDVSLAQLAVEQPPQIAMGELALPVAFELAKRLRKAPRAIATELAAELTARRCRGCEHRRSCGRGVSEYQAGSRGGGA